MRIEIESFDELMQLVALVRGGTSTTKVGAIEHTLKVDASDAVAALNQAVTHVALVAEGTQPDPRGKIEEVPDAPGNPTNGSDLDWSTVDSQGIPHDPTIHSGSKVFNKGDGTWKALRGVDKDLLNTRTAELLDAAAARKGEPEGPVATETHALPAGDEPVNTPADDERDAAPAVDLAALLEAAEMIAGDKPDGMIAMLGASKEFIGQHGKAAFDALQEAVVPGAIVQSFTPAQRRLLTACMELYGQ